jgi:Flp pilus assembly protein TadG
LPNSIPAQVKNSQSGRQRASSHHSGRGQALVEFAFLLPLFLIFIFSIVDLGLGLRAYITVTNAAREGARIGIICPGGTSSTAAVAIKQRVADKSGGLLTTADVTNAIAPCAEDKDVVVEVEYDYTYVTPLGSFVSVFSGGPLHMRSTTTMRSE